MSRRVDRLNSLLKEVISEVIHTEVKNPHLSSLVTVTRVEVSKDVRYAKAFISVIGDEQEKSAALKILQEASGFIAKQASKKVVLRYFPSLTFFPDDSVDKHLRVDTLISEIEKERKSRHVE